MFVLLFAKARGRPGPVFLLAQNYNSRENEDSDRHMVDYAEHVGLMLEYQRHKAGKNDKNHDGIVHLMV